MGRDPSLTPLYPTPPGERQNSTWCREQGSPGLGGKQREGCLSLAGRGDLAFSGEVDVEGEPGEQHGTTWDSVCPVSHKHVSGGCVRAKVSGTDHARGQTILSRHEERQGLPCDTCVPICLLPFYLLLQLAAPGFVFHKRPSSFLLATRQPLGGLGICTGGQENRIGLGTRGMVNMAVLF